MRLLTGVALWLAITSPVLASPVIHYWQLGNGVRTYFVQAPEIPMVQFSVGLNVGSARDFENKQGLANLTNSLMDEGVEGLNGEGIAETLESIGARFGSSSGRDSSIFELRVLSRSKYLEVGADILSRILKSPVFPKNVLTRERKRLIVALEHSKQSPQSILRKNFYSSLFGTHPYSHSPIGTEASLDNISRQDLINFHKRFYVGSNAILVIVGDLTPRAAKRWSKVVVGQLDEGVPASFLPALTPPLKGQDIRIDFPTKQSHLMLGQIGVHRSDADYFALYLGNHILGGGSISRLNNEIRQKRGLAYSVYSYLSPMQKGGVFAIGLQTRNSQLREAESIVRETLSSFIETGPTDEELSAAKANIVGSLPLSIDSNQKIASNLLNIALHDLPLDYLEKLPEKISSITTEQVRLAFAKHIDFNNLVRINVGGQYD